MTFPPFVGSKLKIARARRHFTEAKALIYEFTAVAKLTYTEEDIPEAPHMIRYRSGISHSLPRELPLIIGDVVHNLRSALDLMMCDIARLRGKSASEIKFPFAEDEDSLKRKLENGELRKLGPDVSHALLALAPYKGGNIALRGLHDLDIMDKHKLVIPAVTYGAIGLNTEWGYMPAQRLPPGGGTVIARRDIPKEHLLMNLNGSWVVSFVVLTEGPWGQPAEKQLPFAGEAVLDVLESLTQLTDQIVTSFASKFGGGDNDAMPAPGSNN